MREDHRRMHRRVGGFALMAGPLVLMLVLGGVFTFGGFEDGRAAPPQLPTGHVVPRFSLPAMDDSDTGLADTDLRGRVTVVNFWASWCAPCREEMPLLRGLAAMPGVVIYGINSSDRPAAARRFLSVTGDPFDRIGIDADGAVARAWGAYGLPATFVVTAEGRVAHALVGPLDRRALDRDLLPMIAALSQTP